jgi:SAM-dependent methyltransferase
LLDRLRPIPYRRVVLTGGVRVEPRDRDYDPFAKYYSRRVPYAPGFFRIAASSLRLSPDSFLLDFACGSGELAVGFAPYCGSVLGVDRAPKMLALRKAVPGNVRFLEADLHAGVPRIPRQADLVTIGRALHYLRRDSILPLLDAVTKPSAGVLICNTVIHSSTAWHAAYRQLIDSYVTPLQFPGYYGQRFFAESDWQPAETPAATGLARYDVRGLVAHALSFPHQADAILGRQREFAAKLRAVLKPHFVAEDVVETRILSDGLCYRRVTRRKS